MDNDRQLQRQFATKLPQVYAAVHGAVIDGTTYAFFFSVLVPELATKVTTLANTNNSQKKKKYKHTYMEEYNSQ